VCWAISWESLHNSLWTIKRWTSFVLEQLYMYMYVRAWVCVNKALFYRQMLPGDDSNTVTDIDMMFGLNK